MIKYLGSKRVLLPLIGGIVGALPGVRRAFDVFSGTARVGHALKRAGFAVTCNDHNAYAATLARCYVEADVETYARDAERLLAEFSRLPGRAGWFTHTYCEQSRFFKPENGARVEAIREAIASKSLEPRLEAVLLVSLMEAADRVDSTTGVQMAYLKQWAPRAHNELELRLPQLLPRAPHGPGRALESDALTAAREVEADVAYLDPPYNQHQYLGNYHVWESLVRWDAPEVYGTACKRVDVRTRKSGFNSRRAFHASFSALIEALRAPWIVLSFNDEGYLSRGDAERLLATRGEVTVIECPFKRYVGARIGIYNPRGEKVGRVSHVDNREFLYVVGPERFTLASPTPT